jgi:hypothetical protein
LIIVLDGLERAVSRESMSRLATCDNVAAPDWTEGYVLAPPPCTRRCVSGPRKPDRNLRMKRTAKNANAWGFTAFGLTEIQAAQLVRKELSARMSTIALAAISHRLGTQQYVRYRGESGLGGCIAKCPLLAQSGSYGTKYCTSGVQCSS